MAGLRRSSNTLIKNILTLSFFLIVLNTFGFICLYAQSEFEDAQDDLIKKVIEEVKNKAKERSIKSIAIWRIEADEAQSVDAKMLVDRLNIRLIEEGLLPEQMIDFSEIMDKSSLSRIMSIYGISYFLQGTKTVREGNNIRVQFEMLDMNTNRAIWQREIAGIGEEVPKKETAKVIEENVQGIFDEEPVIEREPKGEALVLLRSLIIPGWGQYSIGKKTKGGILMGSMVAASFLSVGTYINFKIKQEDYQQATSGFDAKWDDVVKSYKILNVSVVLTAGIYFYNLIDTLIELKKITGGE